MNAPVLNSLLRVDGVSLELKPPFDKPNDDLEVWVYELPTHHQDLSSWCMQISEIFLEALKIILEAGAKWPDQRPDVPRLLRNLLHCKPDILRAIIELFKKHQVLTEEQLHELTRTPTMKKHLQSASPIVPRSTPQSTYSAGGTTNNSGGYWKKHWSQH